jgi:hypothetical protein
MVISLHVFIKFLYFLLRFEIKPSKQPDTHGWKKHLRFTKEKVQKVEKFRDFINPYVR